MESGINWLSKRIVFDEINKVLDEIEKEKYGNGLIPVRREKGFCNYIREDGHPISNMWFNEIYDFHDGYARVKHNYGYNFIDKNGNLLSDVWFSKASDFNGGWAAVTIWEAGQERYANFINTKGNFLNKIDMPYAYPFKSGVSREVEPTARGIMNYHFINTKGERINDKAYPLYHSEDSELDFVDGFATVMTEGEPVCKWSLIDTDGKEVPQENDDMIFPFRNVGYGYYFAGKDNKLNGIKLRDANSGITIDQYYREPNKSDSLILKSFLSMERKMPGIINGTRNQNDRTIEKNEGILYIGDYWFLGPSNLKVRKEGFHYRAEGPYGTFKTKIPPIRAIDEQYVICADSGKMYLYDIKYNEYKRTCTREDVEKHVNSEITIRTSHRISKAMKGLQALSRRGVVAKWMVDVNDFLCPTPYKSKGDAFEVQPAYLSVRGILEQIYVKNKEGHYINEQGNIVPLRDHIYHLIREEKYQEAKDMIMNRFIDPSELSFYEEHNRVL